MENGKIYLVATPIGNLEDITLRAINTLKMVDIIAAEDTRHTLKLLNHLEISKPLISYHRHNEDVKADELKKLVKEGKNIAIVTDAGTPGISDPGELIVKEAVKENIEIIPIPGACALVNALIASGLNTKEFIFYGFLPLNNKLRKEKFEDISRQKKTIIIYEAPHRLKSTLEEVNEKFGNIYVVVAKELTKIHETFIRGNVEDIAQGLGDVKGEYIILFEMNGKSEREELEEEIKNMTVEKQFEYYTDLGFGKKDAIKKIAKNMSVSKDDIYKMFI